MNIRLLAKTVITIICLQLPVMLNAQLNGGITPPDDIDELLSDNNTSKSGGSYVQREKQRIHSSNRSRTTTSSSASSSSSYEPRQSSRTPNSSGKFEVPEEFNTALDSLTYSYYARHVHYKNCYKNSANVAYSEKEYRDRLSKLPYEVEMPYNNVVRDAIDLYTGRRRKLVENMLGIGKYYFPIFDDILERHGVPLEFRYLPVIESALNARAVSRAGAAGLWQFMPSTGRMYGLEVNTLVDERRDPVKSTKAAARYLKDLYRIYGDWHLAIAAYNCGPGTVNRAIRRSGGKKNYWQIYDYLPAETRSYVPIFIAANYVMNYYQQHNLCPAEVDMPAHTDTIVVKGRTTFNRISEITGVPIDELEILNPQYRRNIIPGEKYTLRLPGYAMSKFIAMEDSAYSNGGGDFQSSSETVTEAESRSYNSSAPTATAKSSSSSSSSKNRGKTVYHKVRRGENLGNIARKYNVTISQIKKWNHLRGARINAGQKLIIKK
ncbi:MAG: transglycosylase SLT domain-containing protein [Paludibacteraceae bacterium]|nr:transglycosylase SLT domain-containing protein [Paludibacteraceae bacterium]